jgi:hypothetical protein
MSFSIALFLIGAAFILLGLSGGFTISNYSLAIKDAWPRVMSSLIGIVFASFAIYVEIKSRFLTGNTSAKSDGESVPTASTKQAKIQAQDFFYTLDDQPAESFPAMVGESVCVYVLARTVVNLLSQYEKVFERLGTQGCEIRFLFVDPSSEVSRHLYGYGSDQVYRNNITLAAQHLKRLKHVTGPRLQVKVIKHAPTLSIIIIGKQDPVQGFIHAQLYFLHGAVGRDRPTFRVRYGDKWYKVFQDEFNQLWSHGVEWDATDFLNTNKSSVEVEAG